MTTSDTLGHTASIGRISDNLTAQIESRLQLECPIDSQTVKVVKLWGDFYRANYWGSLANEKLLLDGKSPIVATSRFLRVNLTTAGLQIEDLTRPSVHPAPRKR
jgi:hypothetical protein